MRHLNFNGTEEMENVEISYKTDGKSLMQEIEVLIKDYFVLKNSEIKDGSMLLELYNGQKFRLVAEKV